MADKKYYQILGVSPDADEKEIKKAYRKLAKKYHPDTNQGNKAAEQKFKEINEAYDVLGDPEKKKLYDQYGTAAFQEGFDPDAFARYGAYGGSGGSTYGGGGPFANGENGSGQFWSSFGGDGFTGGFWNRGQGSTGQGSSWQTSGFSSDDLFGDLFGNSRSGPGSYRSYRAQTGPAAQDGEDLQTDVTISFEEAASGCDRSVRVKDSAGKTTRAEIRSEPTRFMASTMITAIMTAMIRLYRSTRVPLARAKSSSNVMSKIL